MADFSEIPGWVLVALPVIAILVYMAFGRSSTASGRRKPLSTEYFKGLNHLLNDEQGKALDIFVKLVESDWETIDTHFALGKIFRKNGEIDKAIKIHQGLIARPSLPERYRNKVLLELGYDYLGAGWFDRAEGLFKEVLIHDPKSEPALNNLILIYQQEKDWHKAIDAAEQLFSENAAKVGPMISQYYCELADIARAKGDVSLVEHYANQALRYDSASVRATIILADLAMSADDYGKANSLLQQIEKQDAEFLPMVMGKLVDCHDRLDQSQELLEYLDQLEKRQENLPLLEAHTRAIERYKGRQAAIDYVVDKLNRHPTLDGINQLLSLDNTETAEGLRGTVRGLKMAVNAMQKDQSAYQCKQCGFKANTHYWLCPSCHSWSCVKPYSIESAS